MSEQGSQKRCNKKRKSPVIRCVAYLFGGEDGLLDELVDQNGEHVVARRLRGDQAGALVLLLLFFLLILLVL